MEFADFSLKIVGEIREGHNEALGVRNKEGRWLMSLTGYVFFQTGYKVRLSIYSLCIGTFQKVQKALPF